MLIIFVHQLLQQHTGIISMYCEELVMFLVLFWILISELPSNPRWSIQPEVRGGCDDELFLQQRASKFPLCLLTSGLRLFTVTLPMWDFAIPHQPQFSKNKEITEAWLPYSVFCTLQLSAGWLQARWRGPQTCSVLSWFQKEVAGWHPLIVLWHKHDHK